MKNILSNKIDDKMNLFKEIFNGAEDVIFRDVQLGKETEIRIGIIFIDGLVNGDFISEYIIQALLIKEDVISQAAKKGRLELYGTITKEALAASEVKDSKELDTMVKAVLSGDTLILIDNEEKGVIVSTRQYPNRSVDEPKTETVVRGPRDGFTESFKMNTSLIRRRIKDTELKLKIHSIGRRSKTSVGVMYIDDIVNTELLEEVNKRLESIDIDAVLDSSTLEYLIEDNYLTVFPQMENTERPDAAVASIYEGRIAIVVDNSPFVLLVPATMGTLLQSSEDYYTRWTEASAIRLLRIIAVFLSLLAPSLYIAITAYHPGLLPTRLIYFLAASRVNVPFPAVVEATLMELTMELLREGGTRMAGPIGSTVGIVGGLIIGQAAVEAGVVSPLMIIIVAITSISSFAIPTYEISAAFRICRFAFIAMAAVLGLYGIMLGLIFLASHLSNLSSFGISFTSPYSGAGSNQKDYKDTVIKAPLQFLDLRPLFTFPKDKRRMKRR